MNLIGAILVVLCLVLVAQALPLQRQMNGIYELSREVLDVIREDHRTDREKGRAIRTLSGRLLFAFLMLVGTMTLVLIVSTLGVWLLAESDAVSLSGVWNWLVRLDFQLVTLFVGAVWYFVRNGYRGGVF